MTRYEQAMQDPLSLFKAPQDVCDDPSLSIEEKISILRRWEYDARELQVAEEENMGGESQDTLSEVLVALRRLGASKNALHASPTKQGGS